MLFCFWASCGKPHEFCEDDICAVVQPAELRRSFNKFMDVSVCAATLQLLPGRSCPASSAARNSEATVRLSIHDVDAGVGCLKGKARLAASCFKWVVEVAVFPSVRREFYRHMPSDWTLAAGHGTEAIAEPGTPAER